MRLWRLGIAGSCGVELRAASWATVVAEYGLDLVYESGRREDDELSFFRETKLTSFAAEPRSIRLGLTAWIH
jgi:hypothetical protein